jgi:hypothetical protein
VTRVAPIDEETLRGCLEHALRFDVPHEGSLYLRTFACLYLAAPEADEEHLCDVLFAQAAVERVNPDALLTALFLAIGGQEGDL